MINLTAFLLLSEGNSISEGILGSFQSSFAAITNLLYSLSQISITCNGWTTPTNVVMPCVTAHWISTDFELRGITLALKPINGTYISANLSASVLKQILDSFHISKKLYCITADNPSNNTTMGQSLLSIRPNPMHPKIFMGALLMSVIRWPRTGWQSFIERILQPTSRHLNPPDHNLGLQSPCLLSLPHFLR